MPDFDAFWGSRGPAASMWDDHNRAVDVATMIQDHPTRVEIKRGSTEIAAQTVLATRSSSSPSEIAGPAATVGTLDIVLIGPKDHDTLDDFNVQRGDKFKLWNTSWTVVMVIASTPGMIEAHCEGQQ